MYLCRVEYSDGVSFTIDNVTSVTYVQIGGRITVDSDGLQNAQIPVEEPLWLTTANGIASISGNGMRKLEFVKK